MVPRTRSIPEVSTVFSIIDMAQLERLVVGGLLAVLAVAVAFGPELGRHLTQMRSRGRMARPVLPGEASNLGVESQAS